MRSSRRRHGILSHIQRPEASLGINAQVGVERTQHVGLLRDGSEDLGVVNGSLVVVLRLRDMEARGLLEHLECLEIDRPRDTAATLPLVARSSPHHHVVVLMNVDPPLVLLEHANVGLREVWLRRRTRWGNRRRQGHGVVHLLEHVVRAVTMHESLQADKLSKLAAQHLGVATTKVMGEHA